MLRKCSALFFIFILAFLQVYAQKKRDPWISITPIHEPASSPAVYNHPAEKHPHDTSYLIIGNIQIDGNKRTKRDIILRELDLYPGDTLYADRLNTILEEKRQQLLNSSLFLTVNIYPVNTWLHHTDINVDVFERQYFLILPSLSLADRNFNVWWVKHDHALNRLNYGLKLYENNLTGNKDRLELAGTLGYTHQYMLSYKLPYFDKSYKQGLGIDISFSHNREINYAIDSNRQIFFKYDRFLRQDFKLALHYTYKKAVRLKHTLSLSYNSTKVKDTVLKLNPHFFPNSHLSQKYFRLDYNFSYKGTDIWTYPLHGYSIDATLSRLGFGLLGKINETELIVNASKYWQFFTNTFGETKFTGNIHLPGDQPYFLLKGMGFTGQYLRGLEYYVTEGDRFGILYNTLKQQVFAFRVHSRLLPNEFANIPIRMYFKIYGDLGYNHTSIPGNHNRLANKLLYSYGMGLDIVTFYDAVLKIEYSINLLGEKGLFLHFQSAF